MVSPSLQNPLSLAAHLIAEGAILTRPGVPLIRHLVVDLRWLSDSKAAFLVLGEDLVVIQCENFRFDRLGVHSFGVSFDQGENVVAVLTPIDKAAVSEPDEYRQRLQGWRNCGACIPPLIEDCLLPGRSSGKVSARGNAFSMSL